MQQVMVVKDRGGNVLTSEEGVLRRCKKDLEELINIENERGGTVTEFGSVEDLRY